MSFLDQGKVAATQVGFQTTFNQFFAELRGPESFWRDLVMVVPSTGTQEQYNWLDNVPAFTEWKGERKIAKLRANNYTITNKKWANGIEVDQDDIDDDRLGIYAPKIASLATKAAQHRLTLATQFLLNGFATTAYGAGYDGLAFFSASHKDGNGPTQSNVGTHSLDDTDALNNAIAAMMGLTDEDSGPLFIRPTHLVVGPKLRSTAQSLVEANLTSNGGSNTNYNVVKLIVSPLLVGDYDDYWFLLDLSQPIKPLILQMRREVTFDQADNAHGSAKFLRDKLYYGASARYGIGYGLWQMAWGSDGTT